MCAVSHSNQTSLTVLALAHTINTRLTKKNRVHSTRAQNPYHIRRCLRRFRRSHSSIDAFLSWNPCESSKYSTPSLTSRYYICMRLQNHPLVRRLSAQQSPRGLRSTFKIHVVSLKYAHGRLIDMNIYYPDFQIPKAIRPDWQLHMGPTIHTSFARITRTVNPVGYW